MGCLGRGLGVCVFVAAGATHFSIRNEAEKEVFRIASCVANRWTTWRDWVALLG